MTQLKIFAFLIVFLMTSTVYAQNCPAGIPSGGNPMCIPPDRPESPYYNGSSAYVQQPAQPKTIVIRQHWADRWGAIAMDSAIGVVGVSKGQKNKVLSEKTAMNNCSIRGGRNCAIKIAYKNQCVVIIAGDNDSSIQTAASIPEATKLGLGKCNNEDRNCRVYYSECTMSEIEQE